MKKPYEEMKVTLVGTVSNVVNKSGPRRRQFSKLQYKESRPRGRTGEVNPESGVNSPAPTTASV